MRCASSGAVSVVRELPDVVHEAHYQFLPSGGDPQGDHDLIRRERRAVEQQHEPLRSIVPSLVERAQRPRTCANEAPPHTRPGQPERVQRGYHLLQRLLDRLEAQRDQRLKQR